MIGQNTHLSDEDCKTCGGTGADPKKRKRKCLDCNGSGKVMVCSNCLEPFPCSGMAPNVFDGQCNNAKVNPVRVQLKESIRETVIFNLQGLVIDDVVYKFLEPRKLSEGDRVTVVILDGKPSLEIASAFVGDCTVSLGVVGDEDLVKENS